MGFLISLAANIFFAIIICIKKDMICPFITKIRYYRKTLGKFVDINNGKVIMLLGLLNNDDRTLEEGDVWPIVNLSMLTLKYGTKYAKKNIAYRVYETNPQEINESNMILIGGPLTNMYTKEMLDEPDCSIKYCNSPHSWKLNGVSYPPKENGNKYTDYGILIRKKSKWNANRDILIIAGLSSRAAEGISKMFLDVGYMRLINKNIKNKYFELIIRTEFINGVFCFGKVIKSG